MNHTASERVPVYFTTEYDRFKMIEGNRELNESKINKIIRDIESGIDVLQYYPINVYERNDRLEIKDGQHRFWISRKLKRPVFYILMKDDRDLLDVAKINSNVEKWKIKDFMNTHIQLGNQHYIVLREFMEKFQLAHTIAMRLLSSGTPGGDRSTGATIEDFQRGYFKADHLEQATKLAEACALFNNFKHSKSSAFFTAIDRIMKYGVADVNELAAKHATYPDELRPQAGYKEYIANLSGLYNKRKHMMVIIYEDKKPNTP